MNLHNDIVLNLHSNPVPFSCLSNNAAALGYDFLLQFGNIAQGDRLIKASRSTADRWIRAATARAEEAGAIPAGRRISSHTLRHSYARHLLVNGIPINYLSRWLGHSSIQTTLIYLELVPDPTGSLAAVP